MLTYSQVNGHDEDEDDHMCSALVHMCGEVRIHFQCCGILLLMMWDYKPCALKGMKLPDGKIYSCPERCSIPRWVYFLTLLDLFIHFFVQ
jgi:hypothetical protein